MGNEANEFYNYKKIKEIFNPDNEEVNKNMF